MTIRGPKLLVTGFGPFPGAPENPTETLVGDLAGAPAAEFGGSELAAIVLPTDFRRGWSMLRMLAERFDPDIVLHFGLSVRADALVVERQARKRIDPTKPDASGHKVKCGYARRPGADILGATVPPEQILSALRAAGYLAVLSDDAGGYVCNFILYRSLHAALGTPRAVGFIHVPLAGSAGMTRERLRDAAGIVLRAGAAWWRTGARGRDAGRTAAKPTATGAARATAAPLRAHARIGRSTK